VSCVVSDTGHLSAEQVRQRVLGTPEPELLPPDVDPEDKGAKGKKRK
jgi:hypothetical protein